MSVQTVRLDINIAENAKTGDCYLWLASTWTLQQLTRYGQPILEHIGMLEMQNPITVIQWTVCGGNGYHFLDRVLRARRYPYARSLIENGHSTGVSTKIYLLLSFEHGIVHPKFAEFKLAKIEFLIRSFIELQKWANFNSFRLYNNIRSHRKVHDCPYANAKGEIE